MRKYLAFLPLLLAAAHSVRAQQNVYGCPVQPSDSIFYARIDSLPVLKESSTYTANMGSSPLSWDSSWGVSASASTGPTINAEFAYTPGYNGAWRYPPYYDVDREGGSLGGNYPADHHTIVVDSDTCNVWETYHAYVNPSDGSIETGHMCNGRGCNSQSGWKYGPTSDALPTEGTTDAAGLPLLPLLWRGHEILDGALNHPVRFTMSPYEVQAGNPQWPASGTNGKGGTYAPPYGTRFRLKASVNIDISRLTPQQKVYAQTIITALRRYGLIVADMGFNLNANVDDEAAMDPDIMTALTIVGWQIKPAQLEAVDLSSLHPSPATYLAMHRGPSIPGIMVGTPYHTYLNIQAGTTFQLQSWVNGTTNKNVTWSVASGNIGLVTASGLYTTPESVSGIVQGVLKVTSVADPEASSTVYVRVIPTGPIRIAAGIQTGTMTDKLGQVWLPNLFFRGGNTNYHGGDYPGWSEPSDPTQAAELNVYQTFSYTYGNDQVAHLVVPNGTYKVRLMFAQPYDGASPSKCSPFTAKHNFVGIEIQNQIVVHNFDFGASIDHACAVPVDVNETAQVRDSVLEFALRNTEPDGTPYGTSPMISGVEIIRTK